MDRLLQPERLSARLASLAGRRATQAAAVDQRVAGLDRKISEVEERLRGLYRLIEDGHAEMYDLLRDRNASLKAGPGSCPIGLNSTAGVRPAHSSVKAGAAAGRPEAARRRLKSPR